MKLLEMLSVHVALFPTALPDIALLLFGGACAFVFAYLFTFGIIRVCQRRGWLGKAEKGRTQDFMPRLGGVGIFLAFAIASLLFYARGTIPQGELVSYWLLLAASLLIVLVHAYDDVKGLGPLPKLAAQAVAVIILLGPGWTVVNGAIKYVFNGVLLFGFHNPIGVAVFHRGLPWYREPEITLFIHQPDITWLAIPAVLFTWFWMAGMMNTVNLIDGLDGLATGIVTITGIFITIISWTLGQHSIAILSAIFTGAALGFLPHNWSPAKIYMGDSGSQFLGLGLAVLSIIGGAKLALALMVLGIPILDVAVVMLNRVRHGQSPLHYDKTHLHYRIRATGLSVKQICYLFYGITILFGVLALNMQHIFKLIGLVLVGLTMLGLILWVDQRQRGTPIKLDGPGPEDGSGSTPDVPAAPPAREELQTDEISLQPSKDAQNAVW